MNSCTLSYLAKIPHCNDHLLQDLHRCCFFLLWNVSAVKFSCYRRQCERIWIYFLLQTCLKEIICSSFFFLILFPIPSEQRATSLEALRGDHNGSPVQYRRRLCVRGRRRGSCVRRRDRGMEWQGQSQGGRRDDVWSPIFLQTSDSSLTCCLRLPRTQ